MLVELRVADAGAGGHVLMARARDTAGNENLNCLTGTPADISTTPSSASPSTGPPDMMHDEELAVSRTRSPRARSTRPTTISEMIDWSAIISFAHARIGITSVGLNAVLVVRPRTR